MREYTLPARYRRPHPHCFLFQRRAAGAAVPRHQFYLAYQDLVFSFPVPVHVGDVGQGLYARRQEIATCPPLLPGANEPGERCTQRLLALGGRAPVREQQVLTVEHAPGSFENTVAVDMATGRSAPAVFNPDEIIGVLFAPAGSVLRINQDQDATGSA